MNAFAVVTDSAADIPRALAEKLGIRIVPLHVVFQGVDYLDGIDISTATLLRKIDEMAELPRTSQPTPGDFLALYRQLAQEGYTRVLSIHLAGRLSSTIESARAIAANPPEGLEITVVDSCSATAAEGAMAMEAAVIARKGGTLEEALERITAIRAAARIHFVPDTLENLVKGGRATKAQGLVTSLLNIKLVIGLEDDGSIEVERKAKGIKGAMGYIASVTAEAVSEHGPMVYYLLHTNARQRAQQLRDALGAKAGDAVRMITEATIGPVIATHVGEGAIGVFYYPAALHAPELDGIAEYMTPRF